LSHHFRDGSKGDSARQVGATGGGHERRV